MVDAFCPPLFHRPTNLFFITHMRSFHSIVKLTLWVHGMINPKIKLSSAMGAITFNTLSL